MVSLINAVEQLAVHMTGDMAKNIGNSLSESMLASGVGGAATTITDVTEQTTLMATALKQALQPLARRLDEKLILDSSTEQTGKLIVDCLNRLNTIFDNYK